MFNQDSLYVGGTVHWADEYDVDTFSRWDIEAAARHIGYEIENTEFWFFDNRDGLVEMVTDLRALQCAQYQSSQKIVVVYFRHICNEYVVPHHEVVNNGNMVDILVHGGDCMEYNEFWDAVDIDSNFDNEDKRQGGDEIQEEDIKQCYMNVVMNEIATELHRELEEVCSDYSDSDELRSLESSTDSDDASNKRPSGQRKTPKLKQYRRDIDLRDPQFRLGMEFPCMDEIREAIREYVIVIARPIWLKKNNADKVTARCKGKGEGGSCPFYLYTSIVKGGPTVTCGREQKVKYVTSTWLVARYDNALRANPRMKPSDFITMVMDQYGIFVTVDQIYKAKQKVASRIQGSIEEQYALLWSYAEELKRVNPLSTVKIKT